jgi:hypothetical protein
MGKKRIMPGERMVQMSICFPVRQHEFFAANQDFDVHKFCREAIDEQIRLNGPNAWKFLSEEEKNEANQQ